MLKALVTFATILVIVAATSMFTVPVHARQGGGDLAGPKTTVTVENYSGHSVSAHCWSSEDDIGEHNLGDGQKFSWTFKVNYFGTTKFVCTLKWNNIEKFVTIYLAKMDKSRCASQCLRDIRPDGLYFYHQYEASWEKRYGW
ncbi:self-incompatibility protein S1-like [Lotus japonicus]|uniref:self-incompatibility protein S1-like n=1 Tax=Lotus japonicus TaxID=34305 RepID=UPI002584DC26|nr:self-incompatibility protein S1-like [Lotus japonicus]